MRQRRRLARLTERARTIADKRARAVRATVCVGLDIQRVAEMALAVIRPAHYPIGEAIYNQVIDYDSRTPEKEGDYPNLHGFVDWVWGLPYGFWSLPEELPESWLAAWRHGYRKEFGFEKLPWSPRISNRCEDCRFGLPNVGPDGSFERSFDACPVCGGQRISGRCYFDMRKFSLDGGRTAVF